MTRFDSENLNAPHTLRELGVEVEQLAEPFPGGFVSANHLRQHRIRTRRAIAALVSRIRREDYPDELGNTPPDTFAWGVRMAADIIMGGKDTKAAQKLREDEADRDRLAAEVARLTEERDAAMAGRVKVKPLVWQTSGLKSDRAACYAYGLHGYGYEIFHDGAWFSLRGPDGRLGGALPSPDAAKAAAQADYEARIIAALQPDTGRAEPVAHVTSVTYGTHGNKYHVSWRCDVKLGQPLYTAPQPAPAPQARVLLISSDRGVCVGGRWDGWMMVRHPDGQWVSHHKLEAVDPGGEMTDLLRAIAAMQKGG